jgi:hypothetical protein
VEVGLGEFRSVEIQASSAPTPCLARLATNTSPSKIQSVSRKQLAVPARVKTLMRCDFRLCRSHECAVCLTLSGYSTQSVVESGKGLQQHKYHSRTRTRVDRDTEAAFEDNGCNSSLRLASTTRLPETGKTGTTTPFAFWAKMPLWPVNWLLTAFDPKQKSRPRPLCARNGSESAYPHSRAGRD